MKKTLKKLMVALLAIVIMLECAMVSFAEWKKDERTGRADVHHYGNRPSWRDLPRQNPQADTKGVSAAAGIPG